MVEGRRNGIRTNRGARPVLLYKDYLDQTVGKEARNETVEASRLLKQGRTRDTLRSICRRVAWSQCGESGDPGSARINKKGAGAADAKCRPHTRKSPIWP